MVLGPFFTKKSEKINFVKKILPKFSKIKKNIPRTITFEAQSWFLGSFLAITFLFEVCLSWDFHHCSYNIFLDLRIFAEYFNHIYFFTFLVKMATKMPNIPQKKCQFFLLKAGFLIFMTFCILLRPRDKDFVIFVEINTPY